jgi:hypothetical protein
MKVFCIGLLMILLIPIWLPLLILFLVISLVSGIGHATLVMFNAAKEKSDK